MLALWVVAYILGFNSHLIKWSRHYYLFKKRLAALGIDLLRWQLAASDFTGMPFYAYSEIARLNYTNRLIIVSGPVLRCPHHKHMRKNVRFIETGLTGKMPGCRFPVAEYHKQSGSLEKAPGVGYAVLCLLRESTRGKRRVLPILRPTGCICS